MLTGCQELNLHATLDMVYWSLDKVPSLDTESVALFYVSVQVRVSIITVYAYSSCRLIYSVFILCESVPFNA